jgi:hypothetical protein
MSTLFPKIISYTETLGAWEGPRWVEGEEVPGTFLGSVQPMTEKEIDSLQVGRENTGKVKIYSDTLLAISTEGGDAKGAVVEWNNKKWEVIQANNYNNDLIPHYKYIGEYRGEITP